MALDKSKLYNEFEKIFNVEKSPEVQSETHAAQLITDAIVKYLNDAKIGGLKAPGINPTGAAGGPLPDPAFAAVAGQPMSPVTPAAANQSIMTAGWVSSMMGNIADVKVWATADASMMSYVSATYTSFSIGGYMATGAAAPGPINIGSVMSDESESSQEIASKLSNHIHTFFTACIFTGSYMMGPFVGAAPHVAPLE